MLMKKLFELPKKVSMFIAEKVHLVSIDLNELVLEDV